MTEQEPVYKKTICIDFDGVIHSYTSGWQEIDKVPDPPVPNAFECLMNYLKHYRVCVYSTRSASVKGLKAMKDWFIEYGWPEDHNGSPRGLEFPDQKPPAWLTIDDRCIRFDGTFPTPKEIDGFRPWTKKQKVMEYIDRTHYPNFSQRQFIFKLLMDENLTIMEKNH